MNLKWEAYILFKQGKSYGKIAAILHLSKSTVYGYVKERKLLMEKMLRRWSSPG